ncbi:hypothetical protein ACS127_16805 [Amphibacillus sp. Q70]|uniref:hypothetical protein n=1 Tax=Amphibacillus sp. Q70 TaxID=3453416 RepID=UPI003F841BDA
MGIKVLANGNNTAKDNKENVIMLEEVSTKIENIQSNGIEIVLPKMVPNHSRYVLNTEQQLLGDGIEATLTHLGASGDKEKHEWKIQLLQERLPDDITSDEAIQIIAERNASNDVEERTIGQKKALIHYTSDQGERLNQVWIATDHYFYSIGAPYLSKAELIDVATSMDLK